MSHEIWVTSDHHFNHANIIRHCQRPFKHLHEMNAVMIQRWNDRVADDDTVIHLGDFSTTKRTATIDTFRALNGRKKIIVRGNHDRVGVCELFDEWHMIYELQHDGALCVMCHYKMETWRRKSRGAVHLYGHYHNNVPEKPNEASLNVSVDVRDFAPIRLCDAIRLAKSKLI